MLCDVTEGTDCPLRSDTESHGNSHEMQLCDFVGVLNLRFYELSSNVLKIMNHTYKGTFSFSRPVLKIQIMSRNGLFFIKLQYSHIDASLLSILCQILAFFYCSQLLNILMVKLFTSRHFTPILAMQLPIPEHH